MIVPMKKYSFLVFHQDYRDFLEKLGELGVLHVIENKDTESEESIKDDRKETERVERILEILKTEAGIEMSQTGGEYGYKAGDAVELMDKIEDKRQSIDRLEKHLSELEKEIKNALPWGDFDNDDTDKLKDAGYVTHFYRCEQHRYDKQWEVKYHLFPINRLNGYHYFIILAKEDNEPAIDAEQVYPGSSSPAELRNEYSELEREHKNARQQLVEMGRSALNVLIQYRRDLENRIRFKEVYHESRSISEKKVIILEGWVPEEAEEKLNDFLRDREAVSLVNSPSDDDEPPVMLRNSRFSRLFEPISELFDLPSYNELDLTPYFAPFFMLFFGFCLGDAGYGVFFILFAALLKLKARKQFKPILTLAQYFGIATIIFGLISGTFFGINLIDSGYTITENSLKSLNKSEVPAHVINGLEEIKGIYFEGRDDFLEAAGQSLGTEATERYQTVILRKAEAGIPFVGEFRHLMQDPLRMFYLSIIIGGLQILFGIFIKIMNITRRKSFRHALSTVGWLLLIISLIIYYSGIFDKNDIRYFFYGALALSGILIFFLNRPGENIFARIGSGIWDSYGMVTGLFGDILSYIRLFALGISSAILGFVFNDISLELLNIPYIGWLFFLVLLIAGHGINIFLATLGGFIHPMRLTFVEFYKNADFKGGGEKYQPFVINN
jgi:V/A-type H+-transporting ATPase subunit I